MEVRYQAAPGLILVLDVATIEDMFKELGPAQEVLAAYREGCKKCGCKNIKFNHRKSGKYDFYELQCLGRVERSGKTFPCGAKLHLGQGEGGLFPRRYPQDPNDKKEQLVIDGKKQWFADEGWVRWVKDDSDEGGHYE